MKPFGVCLLRLFLSLMRLFIHILGSCPFLHTVLDALSYASFVPSLKFTQIHCKQLSVFPLWFPKSAVFLSSCVQSRFFCRYPYPLHRIIPFSLSGTLGLPCISPMCSPQLYVRLFPIAPLFATPCIYPWVIGRSSYFSCCPRNSSKHA